MKGFVFGVLVCVLSCFAVECRADQTSAEAAQASADTAYWDALGYASGIGTAQGMLGERWLACYEAALAYDNPWFPPELGDALAAHIEDAATALMAADEQMDYAIDAYEYGNGLLISSYEASGNYNWSLAESLAIQAGDAFADSIVFGQAGMGYIDDAEDHIEHAEGYLGL